VPERAVRFETVAGKGKDKQRGRQGDKEKKKKRPANEAPCLAPARPLLLHPEPQAIEVTAVVPDGPPQFVWLDSRRERITAHWGPERIETLWWRGPSVRRDYYRVATESGGEHWIFCALADGKWFLHGIFA
jgi:protein ImuB